MEPSEKSEVLIYKRSRFGTRLPLDRLYSRSHYWLRQVEPGLWRVGFTRFASRMLGDIVEYQFEAQPSNPVELGQKIGWIEGFKAISDIYAAGEGHFHRANPSLLEDITLLETGPYSRGWLYELQGTPGPDAVDANGYAMILDTTIDRLLAGRHDEGKND